ncbi:SDR family oxidoreductase [Arthrobacter sp. AL12]|uniref:SDR family oxidoreductase n=1 Tax=Arthrobacter sp. AL12 TaxID=3042241 RepID=UPI002499B123|nr:SDR family oxidoreductase [Arthrobacter sp. AL12]MDI3211611.1 SDR family oxidoreductase [Arthrobacter sp. AL12]
MTVLVTGATGNVGSAVLKLLRKANIPARGAVSPEPPTSLVQVAETKSATVAFDFLDPSTWDLAFEGIELVFLVRPPALSNVPRDIVPALEAARHAGVKHIVFLSLQGAESNSVVPHAKIEKWLRTSGLSWTFLRPSYFMQNLSTTHVAEIRDHSQIVIPAGKGRTALVDVNDIAAVAVEVLAHPEAHLNRSWTLTGPNAMTYDEVAEILSAELGRPIRYTRPSVGHYAKHARRDLGMPWEMVLVTAAIYTVARLGRAAGLTNDVRAVTGRPPTSFAEFAHRERDGWIP